MTPLILPSRRGFISGLAAAFAAPAIIRVERLMKVRRVPTDEELMDYATRVLAPMIKRMSEAIAADIMNGGDGTGMFVGWGQDNEPVVRLVNLWRDSELQ